MLSEWRNGWAESDLVHLDGGVLLGKQVLAVSGRLRSLGAAGAGEVKLDELCEGGGALLDHETGGTARNGATPTLGVRCESTARLNQSSRGVAVAPRGGRTGTRAGDPALTLSP